MSREALGEIVNKFDKDQRYLDEVVIAGGEYPDGTWLAILDENVVCSDLAEEHDGLLRKLDDLGIEDRSQLVIHRIGAPRALTPGEV